MHSGFFFSLLRKPCPDIPVNPLSFMSLAQEPSKYSGLLRWNTFCLLGTPTATPKKEISQDTCSRNYSKLSDFSQQLLFNQLFTRRTALCQADRHMPNSTAPAPGISWFPQHVRNHCWKWTVKGETRQKLQGSPFPIYCWHKSYPIMVFLESLSSGKLREHHSVF